MPIKIQSYCDRNVVALPPVVKTLVAGAAGVDVLPDTSADSTIGEIASRFLQNTGTAGAFFAIGQDCTAALYHGYLPPNTIAQGPLDISSFGRGRVNVYAAAATTIVGIVMRRTDGQQIGKNILPGMMKVAGN